MSKTIKNERGDKIKPLVSAGTILEPLRQIYNGYEIEKRWVLLTQEEDHTKKGNGLSLYNKALEKGDTLIQGYIMDLPTAGEMLQELGIELEFIPNTIRLRRTSTEYILTVKDKKSTKRREVEWELDKEVFLKYWPLTEDNRITKRRYTMKHKIGKEMILDAFTDRLLLMAEIEVFDEKDLPKIKDLGFEVTNQKNWSNKAISKPTKIPTL